MAKIPITPHQAFMLKMFADGWGFKLYNDKRGSWNTYWSLVRRGLLTQSQTVKTSTNLVARRKLTDKGKRALADWMEKNNEH
jgi:hypothetical protein